MSICLFEGWIVFLDTFLMQLIEQFVSLVKVYLLYQIVYVEL